MHDYRDDYMDVVGRATQDAKADVIGRVASGTKTESDKLDFPEADKPVNQMITLLCRFISSRSVR